ncbi:restriction endonuclease subunit S [Segatella sp.]|jgi:restriction modification system DNA specificity domain protein|uniref:restriction endonuclease subunit S n=1 Tax=Segatella sp. TaxID=2974253 RepID=UPI0025924026
MEWKEVRLGDVCEIYGRIGFRGYTTNDLVDTPKEGAISLSPKNIINGELNLDKCTYIKWDKYYESPEIMINPNEIIITKTGSSVGRTTFVRRVVHPMTLNPQLVVLKNISENAEFLSYYIKSALFQSVLKSIVVGSAIPTLSQKNLANLIINVPKEVAYQRRIASILSSLDRKIELNNKINADLEEMAQAIFKNWFVDFEPFKDGKFVDSELGMIPEGWKVGCLGDLITIKYGKDHKKLEDGTFPVYGSGGFMRFVNSWLYNGESVLIPRKGTLDNIMYVSEKFWTVDTMFFSVPKMDYVMKYVYNYIKRFDFSKMNEGTSVPSNTAARLNKMQILIPTHEVLEMYDETLCPIYNKRKMNDKESRTLSTLRDTLLPRLMSGELEVPE